MMFYTHDLLAHRQPASKVCWHLHLRPTYGRLMPSNWSSHLVIPVQLQGMSTVSLVQPIAQCCAAATSGRLGHDSAHASRASPCCRVPPALAWRC